jgi:hypothetical protein
MELIVPTDTDLSAPNPIRVETALSRYPVHRLARKGSIRIEVNEADERGEAAFLWKVSYNSEYGQPGPLAYKLDTLVINRRIEEAPRPIPRILRLGSLRDICREMGLADSGKNRNGIKKSLYQNAFAGITARIRYRQNDGTERTLEAAFTRYSIVFTGQELPDGRKADAVYIILSDIYMQVLNGAMTRPLDYDYLKGLPPASQRFYELLSYRMYAAIKNGRPRAKLLYSEFCTYAPLVRQYDRNIVRPQMARIHAPHRESGYLAAIDVQDTVDGDGRPDWLMFYTPGPKARAEYRAFARRGGPVVLEVEPLALDPPPRPIAPGPSPLQAELIGRGITPTIAAELVREHGEEAIRLQIEIHDGLPEKRRGKIADPAAYLVTAIRNGHAAPKGFVSRAERQRREEARQARERQEAKARRRQREEEARERALREEVDAYLKRLTPAGRESLEAEVLAQADPEARRACEETAPARFRATVLLGLLREHLARELSRGADPAGG